MKFLKFIDDKADENVAHKALVKTGCFMRLEPGVAQKSDGGECRARSNRRSRLASGTSCHE
jgi:hypothetical protein